MSFFTAEQMEIIKEKDFKPQTIRYRMRAKKMTFEAAISVPVGELSHEQRLREILTEEDRAEAKRKGVTQTALSNRAAEGWTREEIINTPMQEPFFSPKQLANMKKYGIHYQTARTRVKVCHWSKDDATTIKPGRVGVTRKKKN